LARTLIRLARQWRPAVIHTHRRKEHVLGALAALSSNARAVATIHGRGEFHHPKFNVQQTILKALETLVLVRVFSKLIAVSDDLPEDLPGPDSRKTVIPNSIDVDHVRRAADMESQIRLSERPCNITFLGRLVAVKQVDRILEAMALLESKRPATYALSIIGDGPERNALERHATELRVTNSVSFLGFQANPLPFLASSDVLIFASAHEGLPMTALESLALGVPIVSPPIASIARLIEESGCGTVASSSDPKDLACAVLDAATGQTVVCSSRPSLLPTRYSIEAGITQNRAVWQQTV
jgi:L-malate glycosyltransferase